jgi:hypothetical protein
MKDLMPSASNVCPSFTVCLKLLLDLLAHVFMIFGYASLSVTGCLHLARRLKYWWKELKDIFGKARELKFFTRGLR